MSETKFQLKNPFTVRTNEDEKSLNEELIIEMFPEFDSETTTRKMWNDIVARAAKQTAKITKSLPADLETIQLLNNKNGELLTLTDLKDQEIQRLKDELSAEKQAHAKDVLELTGSLEGLTTKLPGSDQVVVDLSELQHKLLKLASERLSSRYKKEISSSQILKQIFINYTKQESELDFPYVLSLSDAIRINKEMQNGQA